MATIKPTQKVTVWVVVNSFGLLDIRWVSNEHNLEASHSSAPWMPQTNLVLLWRGDSHSWKSFNQLPAVSGSQDTPVRWSASYRQCSAKGEWPVLTASMEVPAPVLTQTSAWKGHIGWCLRHDDDASVRLWQPHWLGHCLDCSTPLVWEWHRTTSLTFRSSLRWSACGLRCVM